MFGETTISYVKIGNHPIETTIYKWLFGVPGIDICFAGTSILGPATWIPVVWFIQRFPGRTIPHLPNVSCETRTDLYRRWFFAGFPKLISGIIVFHCCFPIFFWGIKQDKQQMYGNFQGFPLLYCLAWVGVMTFMTPWPSWPQTEVAKILDTLEKDMLASNLEVSFLSCTVESRVCVWHAARLCGLSLCSSFWNTNIFKIGHRNPQTWAVCKTSQNILGYRMEHFSKFRRIKKHCRFLSKRRTIR